MKRDPEVQQAASQFQLGLLRTPVAGRTGELLGRGTGPHWSSRSTASTCRETTCGTSTGPPTRGPMR